MLNKRYILPLLLCFLCSVSWSFASQQELQRVSPAELGVWGYRQVGFGTMEQTAWEKKSFGEAVKSFKKIKSNKQVPHWPSAYYRFVLTQEEYPTAAAAKARFERLHVPPPGVNTKAQPEYLLREGFIHGNSVYMVSTDVVAFKGAELPRVLNLLKAYVENL